MAQKKHERFLAISFLLLNGYNMQEVKWRRVRFCGRSLIVREIREFNEIERKCYETFYHILEIIRMKISFHVIFDRLANSNAFSGIYIEFSRSFRGCHLPIHTAALCVMCVNKNENYRIIIYLCSPLHIIKSTKWETEILKQREREKRCFMLFSDFPLSGKYSSFERIFMCNVNYIQSDIWKSNDSFVNIHHARCYFTLTVYIYTNCVRILLIWNESVCLLFNLSTYWNVYTYIGILNRALAVTFSARITPLRSKRCVDLNSE